MCHSIRSLCGLLMLALVLPADPARAQDPGAGLLLWRDSERPASTGLFGPSGGAAPATIRLGDLSATQHSAPPPTVEPLIPAPAPDAMEHSEHAAHEPHDAGHAPYCPPAPYHFEVEHEEELGRLTVTPLVRVHDSDVWDETFDDLYGFNLGTVFWREPGWCHGRPVHLGFIAEFGFATMEGEDGVTLVRPERAPDRTDIFSNPATIGPTFFKVEDAQLYTGNLGFALATHTQLGDSGACWQVGVAPVLLIGNINSDFVLVPGPEVGDRQIPIDRDKKRDSGTFVGGDLRMWSAVELADGTRIGGMGFVGVGETEAIFSDSERLNSWGGGVYVDMPTSWVPARVPQLSGSLQWFDWLFEGLGL